jgi:hypothetical protein
MGRYYVGGCLFIVWLAAFLLCRWLAAYVAGWLAPILLFCSTRQDISVETLLVDRV